MRRTTSLLRFTRQHFYWNVTKPLQLVAGTAICLTSCYGIYSFWVANYGTKKIKDYPDVFVKKPSVVGDCLLRQHEKLYLADYISGTVKKPLLVVGPRSVGKSTIVRAVLRDEKTDHLSMNFRIENGHPLEEIKRTLQANSESNSRFASIKNFFTNSPDSLHPDQHVQLLFNELEKLLRHDAHLHEKLPVIVIDEAHNLLKHKGLRDFIGTWMTKVCRDDKLCHIILISHRADEMTRGINDAYFDTWQVRPFSQDDGRLFFHEKMGDWISRSYGDNADTTSVLEKYYPFVDRLGGSVDGIHKFAQHVKDQPTAEADEVFDFFLNQRKSVISKSLDERETYWRKKNDLAYVYATLIGASPDYVPWDILKEQIPVADMKGLAKSSANGSKIGVTFNTRASQVQVTFPEPADREAILSDPKLSERVKKYQHSPSGKEHAVTKTE